VTVAVVEPPEGGANVKSWPVPLSVTVCVLPATLLLLSVMVKEAVRLPEAVGVNVTLRVQLELAATELPHVLV
jgi:hypothetical protein